MNDEKVPVSIALIFSLMLPGLGHLLVGSALPGILWSATVGGSYLAYLPLGIATHIICLLHLVISQEGLNWKKNKVSYIVLLMIIVALLSFYLIYRNNMI